MVTEALMLIIVGVTDADNSRELDFQLHRITGKRGCIPFSPLCNLHSQITGEFPAWDRANREMKNLTVNSLTFQVKAATHSVTMTTGEECFDEFSLHSLNVRDEPGPAEDVKHGTNRLSGPCLEHAC